MGVRVEIHSEPMENPTRTDEYPSANEWYFDPDENGTVRILSTNKDEDDIKDEVCVAEYSRHDVIRAYIYEGDRKGTSKPQRVKATVGELYEEEEDDV